MSSLNEEIIPSTLISITPKNTSENYTPVLNKEDLTVFGLPKSKMLNFFFDIILFKKNLFQNNVVLLLLWLSRSGTIWTCVTRATNQRKKENGLGRWTTSQSPPARGNRSLSSQMGV